jgi:electron transport complex protein RnfB
MSGATIVLACVLAVLLAAVLGVLFATLASRPRASVDALADRIDALLPQTQCGQCQFAGCRPYAVAIASGDADIDHCPPGGDVTVAALARLLGREVRPVNPAYGVTKAPVVAWIDEDRCIGCARCLPVCPVDAIVGAQRYMHTVVVDECTGCELCVPACPVDCIELRPAAGARSRSASWAA